VVGVACNNFEKIWDDTKTGCKPNDVSFYRAQPPEGYVRIGDYAETSHASHPSGSMIVVREVGYGAFPLLAKPIKYAKMWDDHKTGASYGDVSIWRPIAPAGYVALGDVAMPGKNLEPPVDYVMCVHQSVLAQGRWKGEVIWMNRNTKGNYGRISMWRPEPGRSGGGTAINTFVSKGDHTPISDDERPAWVLIGQAK